MNSASTYLVLCVLLITALLAIIVLLITVTEHPDSMFEDKRIYTPSKIDEPNITSTTELSTLESSTFFQQMPFSLTGGQIFQHDGTLNLTSSSNSSRSTNSSTPEFMLMLTSTAGTSLQALQTQISLNPKFIFGSNAIARVTATAIPSGGGAVATIDLRTVGEISPSGSGRFMGVFISPIEETGATNQTAETPMLFLPKDNGDVEVRELGTFSVSRQIQTGLRVYRLRPIADRTFVILDGTFQQLVLFNELKGILQKRALEHPAKDLQVFGGNVYTINRFNEQIKVYSGTELEPVGELTIQENSEYNCNFIRPTVEGIFVSCQSKILLVANNGSIVEEIPATEGHFSLPVNTLPNGDIVAVKRGQKELNVFDKQTHKLKRKLRLPTTGLTIWTAIAFYEEKTLFALEYISNKIDVLSY